MKARTLFILLVILAVLIFLAVQMSKKQPGRETKGPGPESTLLGDLDLNRVAEIRIVRSGVPATMDRKGEKWVVSSMYDYPADFVRVAEQMRALADLKAGQTIRGSEKSLEEFGLAGTNFTRIAFADDSGKVLAQLDIGSARMAGADGPYGGMPDGQYVRVNDGPVTLVDKSLGYFPRNGDEWIRKEIMSVPASDIIAVSIISTQGTYTLHVPQPGRYALKGLATNQLINAELAGRMTRALEHLQIVTLADPARGDKDLGLENPERCVWRTADGMVYTAILGTGAEYAGGRVARFTVKYESPPAPTLDQVKAALQAEKRKAAEDRNAEISRWTYVLSTYSCDSMSISRDRLVKTIEAPKADVKAPPVKQ